MEASAYLVYLVGTETLESEYVLQELEWTIEANVKIIPVFHDGFDAESKLNNG